MTLTEAGSSLLYPYLQAIQAPLHAKYPNITLQPAPGGSGKGISDAIAGTTTLGGSDAYLSPGQLAGNQGLMNLPVVISSQAINYNLKGIKNLRLTGPVLARIYQGRITAWNDPAIRTLNPGVKLPDQKIVPVRRVDSSGDTFLFTSFLSATDPAWKAGPGLGTTVTWPAVGNELTAQGNPGMVQTCASTPGCIAYAGVSVQPQAKTAGLGEAMLRNKAGKFTLPTPAGSTAAAAAGAAAMPENLAQPLINEPGASSYPIVNFEYLIVKAKQAGPDQAKAIRTLVSWVISPTGGSRPKYLDKVGFVPLPASVRAKVNQAITRIHG